MPTLRDEIRQQPETIRRTIDSVVPSLAALKPYTEELRNGRPVVVTGMGGSYAAGTLCHFGLMENRITAFMMETSELVHRKALLEQKPLTVIISQSGQSVEIVRLVDDLKRDPAHGAIIGVTNTPGSALATGSTQTLLTQAGEEKTVATKTYTCTVAGLVLLADALCGKSQAESIAHVQQAADAIEAALPAWETRAREIGQAIKDAQFVEFLGRGASRASALTGALVTKETAKIPTEGMVGGQFRHGPLEVLQAGIVVAIFMGSGAERALNEALATEIETRGAQVIRIGSAIDHPLGFDVPSLDDFVLPIAEIVPVQLLAAELAEQRGFVAGEFRHGTKVTTTE